MFGKITVFLLAGAVGINTVSAQVPNIPDSSKPGAIRDLMKRKIAPSIDIKQTIQIPVVADRPVDDDKGAKILVSKIQITGQAVDRADYNVSVKAMQALLDSELKGFPDGITMGQLQKIADKLTGYYRERGFILAQAFIPAQKVNTGVVEFKVLEGRLGQVFVENNEYYSASTLKRVLQSLIGQPVVNDEIEGAILELVDLPGLEVSAVFTPGKNEMGTTDLVLKVQNEEIFNLVLNVDNHGSEFTGVYRPRLDAVLNNVTGYGDLFSASFFHSIDPALSKYGAINYQLPVFTPYSVHPVTVGIALSHSQFDVGGEFKDLDIDAETSIAGISFKYPLLKSRLGSVGVLLDLSRKRATNRIGGERVSRDDLSVLKAGFNFQRIDLLAGRERVAGNQGGVYVVQGFSDVLGSLNRNDLVSSRTGASGENAGGEFTKVVGDYSRLQHLGWGSSLLLRAEGQWSEDLLVSLEQFSLGGPFNVRAYPNSEVLVDSGYFGSAEFAVNAPGFADEPAFWGYRWGDIIQFSTFFDYSAGYTHQNLPGQEAHTTLAGYGFGAKIMLPGVLQMSVTTAFPVTKADASNNHKPQTFFSVSVQY